MNAQCLKRCVQSEKKRKCNNFGKSGWQLLFYLQSVLTGFNLGKYSTSYFKNAVKLTGPFVICSHLWGTLDNSIDLYETVKKAHSFGEIRSVFCQS